MPPPYWDTVSVICGETFVSSELEHMTSVINQTNYPPLDPPFHSTRLSDSVAEHAEDETVVTPTSEDPPRPSSPTEFSVSPQLAPSKWAFLGHLSLADNALTFITTEILPHLSSLTHFDLSSNLLVSVPPGSSSLYNLVSLNLSDNMIDSVLGIYKKLGQVLALNLSRNRLDSLCSLERLVALDIFATNGACWRSGNSDNRTTTSSRPSPIERRQLFKQPSIFASPLVAPTIAAPPRHQRETAEKAGEAHRAQTRRTRTPLARGSVSEDSSEYFGDALSARGAGVVIPRTAPSGGGQHNAEGAGRCPAQASALALTDSDAPPSPVLVRPPPDCTMNVRVSARRSAARRACAAASV
ncbi:hypothetical protein EDB85DRAFT_2289493 [Lactarius pseudohatsudake]|nr:hypothetical protein EDB85DRAFT_2289493 [Lactarius pseudohatsudake]